MMASWQALLVLGPGSDEVLLVDAPEDEPPVSSLFLELLLSLYLMMLPFLFGNESRISS